MPTQFLHVTARRETDSGAMTVSVRGDDAPLVAAAIDLELRLREVDEAQAEQLRTSVLENLRRWSLQLNR